MEQLQQVVQALNALYFHPDPDIKHKADNFLKNFQHSESAWTVSDQLLALTEASVQGQLLHYCHYFGAQTLHNKLLSRFSELPTEARSSLRLSLFDKLRNFSVTLSQTSHLSSSSSSTTTTTTSSSSTTTSSTPSSIVLTQLAVALTLLALKDTFWSSPLTEVLTFLTTSTATQPPSPLSNVELEKNLLALMEFLTVFPEESSNLQHSISEERRKQVAFEMEGTAGQVAKLLHYCLTLSVQRGDRHLQNKTLNCLCCWLRCTSLLSEAERNLTNDPSLASSSTSSNGLSSSGGGGAVEGGKEVLEMVAFAIERLSVPSSFDGCVELLCEVLQQLSSPFHDRLDFVELKTGAEKGVAIAFLLPRLLSVAGQLNTLLLFQSSQQTISTSSTTTTTTMTTAESAPLVVSLLTELDEDDVVKGLARLMVELGDKFLSLFVLPLPPPSESTIHEEERSLLLSLASSLSSLLLPLLLQLTAHNNFEVVEHTLFLWDRFTIELAQKTADQLADPTQQHQQGGGGGGGVGGSIVATGPQHALLVQLFELLAGQLAFPQDFDQMSEQEQDDVRDFRHQVGDLLKDMCPLMGYRDCLLRLLQRYRTSLQLFLADPSKAWQRLEGDLFCARTLSSVLQVDSVLPAISDCLPELLISLPQIISRLAESNNNGGGNLSLSSGSQHASQQASQQAVVEYTATLLFGAYAEFAAQRNFDFWRGAVSFLLQRTAAHLSLPAVAANCSATAVSAATFSLFHLLKSGRSLLWGNLPAAEAELTLLFELCQSPYLKLQQQIDLLGAAGVVISLLPEEKQEQLLRSLLLPPLKSLTPDPSNPSNPSSASSLPDPKKTSEEFMKISAVLREIAAHPGSEISPAAVVVFAEPFRRLLPALLERFGTDEAVMEQLMLSQKHLVRCSKVAYRRQLLAAVLAAAVETFLSSPLPLSSWLYLCNVFVGEYNSLSSNPTPPTISPAADGELRELLVKSMAAFSNKTFSILETPKHFQMHSDLVEEYLELMIRVQRKSVFLLEEDQQLGKTVQMAVASLQHSRNKKVLEVSVDFFVQLLLQTRDQPSRYSHYASANLGERLHKRLLDLFETDGFGVNCIRTFLFVLPLKFPSSYSRHATSIFFQMRESNLPLEKYVFNALKDVPESLFPTVEKQNFFANFQTILQNKDMRDEMISLIPRFARYFPTLQ